MASCPFCGIPSPDGATRCTACGRDLRVDSESAPTLVDNAPYGAQAARTQVVGSFADPREDPSAARTLVMGPRAVPLPPPPAPSQPAFGAAAPVAVTKTLVGGIRLDQRLGPAVRNPADRVPPAPPSSSPSLESKEHTASRAKYDAREIGETLLPDMAWQAKLMGKRDPRLHPRKAAHPQKKRPAKKRMDRSTWLLLAGAVIVLAAITFVALRATRSPLSLRVGADAEGRPLLLMRCPSCADGTVVSAWGIDTVLRGGAGSAVFPGDPEVGEVAVPVTLTVGEDHDEVSIDAEVPYRIHVDPSTLSGDKPAVTVAVALRDGTNIEVSGRALNVIKGTASTAVDVTEACAAPGEGPLVVDIPYVVSEAGSVPEPGSLHLVIARAPLTLHSPGPRVVIDGPSFELAGLTAPAGRIVVAGRPITVGPDGVFRQTMNVSSLGRTQIDVRAVLDGYAPRIVRVAVERVASFEAAAVAFVANAPARPADVRADPAAFVGQMVVLGGKLRGVDRKGPRTIATLDLGSAGGCADNVDACNVRVIKGGAFLHEVGQSVRVFGRVRGAGSDGMAEIEADFTLGAAR